MPSVSSVELGMTSSLAIYIHWPYCTRICPYCDFNVYKNREDEALGPALLEDLTRWRSLSGPRSIRSVHFGGGTPSLMSPALISDLLDHIHTLWGLPNTIEIGLEANPKDINKTSAKAMKAAGINRLSLGVQSFHDQALHLLGRDHDGEAAYKAACLSREIFQNISLDLIYGWYGQTISLWEQDLDLALQTKPHHLSAYQLTIEPGTSFGALSARGKTLAVGSDESADFYDITRTRLTDAGFDHYEVSNFAKPNYPSQHNLTYWQGEDYAGIGSGAHGRLRKGAEKYTSLAPRERHKYLRQTHIELTPLSPTQWGDEYVLMGLRISQGISLEAYETITGAPLNPKTIEGLIAHGLLIKQGDRLSATPQGRQLLDHVTEKLLT